MKASGEIGLRNEARLTALFIALAMLLGGGGSPNWHSEWALVALTILFGAIWLLLRADSAVDRSLVAMAAVIVAVPLLQLVPLPPDIWHHLPGRDAMRQALATVGQGDSWRPLTVSPSRTLASLVSLGPPILAMLMVARLDASGRRTVLAVVAIMGVLAAVLGALQLASGDAALRFYRYSHSGVVTGFFANRNAAADMFLIALLACAAWFGNAKRSDRLAVFAPVALVLAMAAVLTGSRAGIALLPVALVGVWLMLRSGGRFPARVSNWLWPILAALGAAAAWTVLASERVGAVLSRFAFAGDFRFELWRDAADALSQFWPWGSGVGTASLALIASERLEVVDETLPNRVHNDYLEWLIEAGLPGVVALALVAILLASLALRAARSKTAARSHLLFAVFALGILAAHSLIDYPLRSMALAVLAGVACGMLAPLRSGSR